MEKIKKEKMNILISNNYVYIEKKIDKKFLMIDKIYFRINMSYEYSVMVTDDIINYFQIECLLGIIKICGEQFLIVVKQSNEIGKIENNLIFQIKNIDLIQITNNSIIDNKEFEIVSNNLKNLLSCGSFYYSIGFDLSSTFQEFHYLNIKNKDIKMLLYSNSNYMWNYKYLNPLFEFQIDNDFIAPCIYGFVEMKKININKPIILYIIERINVQLIKPNPNNLLNINNIMKMKHIEFIVNFNENEFFSYIIYETFSFNNKDNFIDSTLIDFTKIIENYQNILSIINLNNDDLTNSIITKLKLKNEALQGKMETISISNNNILKNIESNLSFSNYINYYGYYFINKKLFIDGQINIIWLMTFNNSISYSFNENNLNLIKRIIWFFLRNVFIKVGLKDINNYFNNNDNNIVFKEFNNLWFEYKNYMINNSNKLNNLNELNTILRLQSQINYENIKQEKNHIFKKRNKLDLLIITWNVAAISSQKDYNLYDLFSKNNLYEKNKFPDLIIIGLQEIVELEVGNIIINSNSSSIEFWRNKFKNEIKNVFTNQKYNIIKELNLVGIYMIIFSKENLNISVENQIIIKTGILGALGNKGSVILLLKCYESLICLCCSHFNSGQSNNNERLKILKNILNSEIENKKKDVIKFKNIEMWFIFGDLNFRIDSEYETVISNINEGKISNLLKNDQFLSNKNANTFSLINEGNIEFNPTYKYKKESNDYYYKNNKIRIPSWCDRIFYKKYNEENMIILKQYNCIQTINYSDHKPVFGVFEIYCKDYYKNEREKVLYEMININKLME